MCKLKTKQKIWFKLSVFECNKNLPEIYPIISHLFIGKQSSGESKVIKLVLETYHESL